MELPPQHEPNHRSRTSGVRSAFGCEETSHQSRPKQKALAEVRRARAYLDADRDDLTVDMALAPNRSYGPGRPHDLEG